MKKVFLDTNVVLDLLDTKRDNHTKAKELLSNLIMEDMQIVISEDMLSTIYYISKDKQKVLEFFEVIIDEWYIVPLGKEVVLQAISLCKANTKLDLEDTMQSICAKYNGCDTIYTSDKKFIGYDINVLSYEF